MNMVCYAPMTAYRSRLGGVTFSRKTAIDPSRPMRLPCGQCVGCRLEKSRQWAVRCMHEAQQHENNCFLTLTYDDLHLPQNYSLNPEHMTRFWKRLRKKYGAKIRYFYCGEYGEKSGRPHYHACVFNHEFADRTHWKTSRENTLYRSKSLEALWPYGFSSIGELTFQSAAYVARYIMKKRTGNEAELHYEYIDTDGTIHNRLPEYVRMSRRPGLGQNWITQYKSDVYPDDFVIIEGNKYRSPRYYDTQLPEKESIDLKSKRVKNAEKHADNNTPERRRVRERIHIEKANRLIRPEGKEEL